jgi:hypothetical protein
MLPCSFLAAIIGIRLAAIALFFLKLAVIPEPFFYKFPAGDLGLIHAPVWWPFHCPQSAAFWSGQRFATCLAPLGRNQSKD